MSTIFIDKHGITREQATGRFADKPGAKPYFDLVALSEEGHARADELGADFACPFERIGLAADLSGVPYEFDVDIPALRYTFDLGLDDDDAKDEVNSAAVAKFQEDTDTIIDELCPCDCHTCDGRHLFVEVRKVYGELDPDRAARCEAQRKETKEILMNIGKKAGAASMIGALAFSLAACGAQSTEGTTPPDQGPSVTEQAEAETVLEGDQRGGHQVGDLVESDMVDEARAALAGTVQAVVQRDGQYVVADRTTFQSGDIIEGADAFLLVPALRRPDFNPYRDYMDAYSHTHRLWPTVHVDDPNWREGQFILIDYNNPELPQAFIDNWRYQMHGIHLNPDVPAEHWAIYNAADHQGGPTVYQIALMAGPADQTIRDVANRMVEERSAGPDKTIEQARAQIESARAEFAALGVELHIHDMTGQGRIMIR